MNTDMQWCFENSEEAAELINELEQRLAEAESLMNRMAMNLMLSGYEAESNSNNPIKEWLDLVIKWKKSRGSDEV